MTSTEKPAGKTTVQGVDARTFAKNVREARNREGISLRQLAYITGSSVAFLSRVERGMNGITLNKASQIAHALRIPLYIMLKPRKSDKTDSQPAEDAE
ncbi:helix-turn-helix domain-containing protein [Asaia spathodeae]|uniref:Helix-turn-helix transcriptional regulator n=1 Tax=Asaia spathodeae TaxID=657016 RepID=A0ABX2P8L2_9PROT|nr:helix-turn-helix transcriptional regulator [Asaia spathodeae]GBR16745.1 hypothetical protein AA105894_1648 [Asaia spathodeae NBRC 105894]